MSALVTYYRAAEADVPDLSATVLLGTVTADLSKWKGRSLDVRSTNQSMANLRSALVPGRSTPLTISTTGKGTLFYSARLRYAPELRTLGPLDVGFTVERTYLVKRKNKQGVETWQKVTDVRPGDLVQVRLVVSTAQERHNVVIDDPLPAGLEALDAQLASTSQTDTENSGSSGTGFGIDHTELRDDRVLLFATTLQPGTLDYTYMARATTSGSFIVPPAQAEEMYRPEIFGRNGTVTMNVAG